MNASLYLKADMSQTFYPSPHSSSGVPVQAFTRRTGTDVPYYERKAPCS